MSLRPDIRFEVKSETLVVYRPDGLPLLTFVELGQRLDEANQQLKKSHAENAKLVAKWKALGVDPAELYDFWSSISISSC